MLYKRVYEALRASIAQGEYPVGKRLPSGPDLSKQFGVSPITIKSALELLRNEGMIIRRPRIGTVVTSATPVPSSSGIHANGAIVIGCVLTSFDDTFGNKLIEGILAAAGTDANVMIKRSGGNVEDEEAHIRSLIDAGVAGLILLPSSSDYIPPAALELVARKLPVVILDRLFDGVPVSAVCSDNLGGGRMATEHLFELGHKRVGFVSAASHVSSSDERRNGYVDAHTAKLLPLENRAELGTIGSTIPGSIVTLEEDVDRLGEFVRGHPDFTGYVAAEYNIALMLREACRRLGLDVPGDVSIVCFDHPDAFVDFGAFRYTHVRQGQREMGIAAVELVRRQIADPHTIEKVSLPTKVVTGASTVRPQKG